MADESLHLSCPDCGRELELTHMDGGQLANLSLADAICRMLGFDGIGGAICSDCILRTATAPPRPDR